MCVCLFYCIYFYISDLVLRSFYACMCVREFVYKDGSTPLYNVHTYTHVHTHIETLLNIVNCRYRFGLRLVVRWRLLKGWSTDKLERYLESIFYLSNKIASIFFLNIYNIFNILPYSLLNIDVNIYIYIICIYHLIALHLSYVKQGRHPHLVVQTETVYVVCMVYACASALCRSHNNISECTVRSLTDSHACVHHISENHAAMTQQRYKSSI